jgi:RNA:NAD 2'-phosphotransferase (TPT1/KptA family)
MAVDTVARLNPDFNAIERVVADNNKQRFSLIQESGVWLIRANQGMALLRATHRLPACGCSLTSYHSPPRCRSLSEVGVLRRAAAAPV